MPTGPSEKEASAGPSDLENFDEEAYLARYSDVARAVVRGDFSSGRAHFEAYGRSEGRLATHLSMPSRVELDPTSSVLSIKSPAFSTTPPAVVQPELIPEDLRHMYAILWQQQRPAREVTCHLLHDVFVAGDGLVFDRQGRLVAASAHQTSSAQIEQATAKVKGLIADGGGTAIGGTTLICEKIGVVNYGHWLVEMAPLAFLLREQLRSEWFLRAPIIEGVPAMSTVIRDTLDLLGIEPARIRWGLGSMPQRYERLVLTYGFSHHGIAYSPITSSALSAMAEQLPADGKRRIWVSRSGARRRMSDEEGLCGALAAKGWTIVLPETMSLRRQISLFKDAEVVAGVAGAGLTNFGFAPSTARIVVFVPARMPDIFFWTLAQMKRQAYTEVRCLQEHTDTAIFNWDGLLMMETSEALAHIDAILAT